MRSHTRKARGASPRLYRFTTRHNNAGCDLLGNDEGMFIDLFSNNVDEAIDTGGAAGKTSEGCGG